MTLRAPAACPNRPPSGRRKLANSSTIITVRLFPDRAPMSSRISSPVTVSRGRSRPPAWPAQLCWCAIGDDVIALGLQALAIAAMSCFAGAASIGDGMPTRNEAVVRPVVAPGSRSGDDLRGRNQDGRERRCSWSWLKLLCDEMKGPRLVRGPEGVRRCRFGSFQTRRSCRASSRFPAKRRKPSPEGRAFQANRKVRLALSLPVFSQAAQARNRRLERVVRGVTGRCAGRSKITLGNCARRCGLSRLMVPSCLGESADVHLLAPFFSW